MAVAGPVFRVAMSACATTSVVLVAALSAPFGSVVVLATLAVLETIKPLGVLDGTCTTSVMTTVPLLAMVPRLAVTAPPDCEAVPCVVATETNVVPVGTTSVTTVFAAGVGPGGGRGGVEGVVCPGRAGAGGGGLVKGRGGGGGMGGER